MHSWILFHTLTHITTCSPTLRHMLTPKQLRLNLLNILVLSRVPFEGRVLHLKPTNQQNPTAASLPHRRCQPWGWQGRRLPKGPLGACSPLLSSYLLSGLEIFNCTSFTQGFGCPDEGTFSAFSPLSVKRLLRIPDLNITNIERN